MLVKKEKLFRIHDQSPLITWKVGLLLTYLPPYHLIYCTLPIYTICIAEMWVFWLNFSIKIIKLIRILFYDRISLFLGSGQRADSFIKINQTVEIGEIVPKNGEIFSIQCYDFNFTHVIFYYCCSLAGLHLVRYCWKRAIKIS